MEYWEGIWVQYKMSAIQTKIQIFQVMKKTNLGHNSKKRIRIKI